MTAILDGNFSLPAGAASVAAGARAPGVGGPDPKLRAIERLRAAADGADERVVLERRSGRRDERPRGIVCERLVDSWTSRRDGRDSTSRAIEGRHDLRSACSLAR
jgi:hypothetical protein